MSNFPKTSNPAESALIHAGFKQLEDLTRATEKEILGLHGMGPKAFRILKAALEEKGLSFAPAPEKAKSQEETPVSGFPKIGQPAERALHGAGYTQLEDLTRATEKEISGLHGMGPKAIGILRTALEEKGLSFAFEKEKSK